MKQGGFAPQGKWTGSPQGGVKAPEAIVLPDPVKRFANTSARLDTLAAGHPMEDWLRFMSQLARGQHAAVTTARSPAITDPSTVEQAVEARMPPLSADGHRRDPAWRDGLAALLDNFDTASAPSQARAVAAELRAADVATVRSSDGGSGDPTSNDPTSNDAGSDGPSSGDPDGGSSDGGSSGGGGGGLPPEEARVMTEAIDILKQYRAVMDAALVRTRLAECFTVRGERNAAEMEIQAAQAVFKAAGATGYLARCGEDLSTGATTRPRPRYGRSEESDHVHRRRQEAVRERNQVAGLR